MDDVPFRRLSEELLTLVVDAIDEECRPFTDDNPSACGVLW